MDDKYEITIAIPSYRNVKTLARAIDSVMNLNDAGVSWKLFIAEDYSENHVDIENLINGYEDPRIKYICNNPKLGMASNWNFCIEKSETEFVALLHDDDYLLPDYLFYVRQILDSDIQWDCITFAHEFEIDGVRINDDYKGIRKYYKAFLSQKIRKLRAFDYLCGGYNYIAIPTCGILFKKATILKNGGYKATDGYSADERFFERFIRQGGTILFYNVVVGVYTYTSGMNLSSNHKVKRRFVLENIEHRKEVAKESKFLNGFIEFWNDSMTLYQVGRWKDVLIPELRVSKKMRYKTYLFTVLCKIYQYLKVIEYKKLA